MRAALATVLAGRESLRATEASVLQSVIQAYEDVRRDERLFVIRQEDVRSLGRVLDEITARRAVGQISRTDVAQIQSQVATAQAAEAAAEAQVQISRSAYAAVVGRDPAILEPPAPLPNLPATVELAFELAEAENPDLRQADLTERASRARISAARGANRPSLAASAQVGYLGSAQPAQGVDYSGAFTAQLTLTQPLFTGGQNASVIRQSIEQNSVDRVGIERIRRSVVQSVAQAWNQVVSVQRVRLADRSAMEAASVELQGMQAEYRLALRSTLEVLTADEALRAAQISLTSADHDEFVAEAALLSATGRLEMRYLVTGGSLYTPESHFNRVRNAGATPYEALIAGLDKLGAPGSDAPAPDLAPPHASSPAVLLPAAGPKADAPLSKQTPMRGAPATMD